MNWFDVFTADFQQVNASGRLSEVIKKVFRKPEFLQD